MQKIRSKSGKNLKFLLKFNQIMAKITRYIKNETQNGKILSSLCPVAKRKKKSFRVLFWDIDIQNKIQNKIILRMQNTQKISNIFEFPFRVSENPFLSLFCVFFEFTFWVFCTAFWVFFEFISSFSNGVLSLFWV